MKRESARTRALVGAILLVLCLQLRPAEGDFHENEIEEVMAGLNGDATIQFIEMKMLGTAQNCQGTGSFGGGAFNCVTTGIGASLLFFDAAGTQTGEFIFPGNTPIGEVARSILIGTQSFANLGIIRPDFIMPNFVVPDSGKVCYQTRPGAPFGVNQCLSYGRFTGSTEGFGTPAAALSITGTLSLKRVNNGSNNSTSFQLGTLAPLNNAMAPPKILAAILPSGRSVQVGVPATAFATLINTGDSPALGCGISPSLTLPASFVFQATDSTTNKVIGTSSTPMDIPAKGAQSFVFAFTPTGAISPRDVSLNFDCTNTDSAPTTSGLNTLLLSASTTPVPDIIALAATVGNTGVVGIPGTTGTGAFAVATVNVGVGGTITASADTGGFSLPVSLSLCATNPTTGACLAKASSSVATQIDAGATPTFSVFVKGNGTVRFSPATNRIFVRFKDTGGVTRGATSVAVETQTP